MRRESPNSLRKQLRLACRFGVYFIVGNAFYNYYHGFLIFLTAAFVFAVFLVVGWEVE